ncbi:tripartite tricarboxylate transporter substrate binding protein [Candidimonas sp. SYP-B2681]|uniref:Bug family tripartite tricarboxylate transporter substrate binding protein n=1 Tax=Candidimonas sp. SYP-B2681 TaxID=2497686 RepID=UPI000F89BD4F|nr:tripartite tricarboxylate transporter substrate binding protein [Candidimonas sp. SYP-B2681]RTZ44394.1 tripartite tricarboxylate transporter substrate binding protein [Candidimonas sp. SYP-B2681]
MSKRDTLKKLSSLTLVGVLSTTFALSGGTAVAAAWPERPVRLVVPFAPGGSNDVIARKLADKLSKSMGQTFIIENRAGAGGVVGAGYVAAAAPDGYTFLFISGSLATSAAVQKTSYDVKTAFEAVSLVADAPFVVITRKDFPAKDIKGLLSYAKDNPGKINFGSAGLGDSSQMATELLANKAGVKMQTVGYKGIAPAQMDLVAGRLDMIITTMASIRGTPTDELPKLAFTGEERDPDFAHIPTVKEETGLNYVVNVWWGVFGPKGLDTTARDKLNAEIRKAVSSEDFAQFLKSAGARPKASTPAQLQALLESDVDQWMQTAEAAGIRAK